MRRVSWNLVCRFLELSRSKSRLAWGVWVEMCYPFVTWDNFKCHASHEACELKSHEAFYSNSPLCHASHEACELKYDSTLKVGGLCRVTPRMRRVSWNATYCEEEKEVRSHASHEACELKFLNTLETVVYSSCHASHEACELKLLCFHFYQNRGSHASHEACELKLYGEQLKS